ncbi:hypothetical protein BJY01DRAFT_32235 [Aspergillus pseudoustus]|uniref:Secreted protein n=1 Tax=Aspergillus pseudoustus TaxID=1810923 RepID=A0ABR4JG05_9EURO
MDATSVSISSLLFCLTQLSFLVPSVYYTNWVLLNESLGRPFHVRTGDKRRRNHGRFDPLCLSPAICSLSQKDRRVNFGR